MSDNVTVTFVMSGPMSDVLYRTLSIAVFSLLSVLQTITFEGEMSNNFARLQMF